MNNPPQLDNSALSEPDRATPPCPHFGPCGGCQLQHVSYQAQLRNKSAQLCALLAATGLSLPELQLHPSPPFHYRNRIRLTLGEIDGRLRAGYIGAHQNVEPEDDDLNPRARARFLPITECPIAAPILWRATEALLARINQDPARWLHDTHLAPDQLELFTTADESSLQFTLYLRAETRAAKTVSANLGDAFSALCEALRVNIPELTGAGISLLPPISNVRSRRTEQPRPGPSWGAPGLTYSIPALQPATNNLHPATYWVPRGAFFQINRFLLLELLALATSNRIGPLAWDLYAGVGLFSRALARSFAEVVAVEIAEPAASALASTKLANLRAVKSTTLDFLRAFVLQRERPSLIVFDPPRSGAGPEVCALLARIAAPTLIYISCSPEALARDLTALAASGYSVAELHLVDLFPQTTHIETVAILTR
jgi:23S rRNA (uracil1939-C5)-methyltransferase